MSGRAVEGVPASGRPWQRQALAVLVVAFPVGSVALQDAGSVIYALLLLLALAYGWAAWREAGRDERWLVAGYGVLFAVAALSLFQTEALDVGVGKLERYLRLASLGLIYLLLRRFWPAAGRGFLAATAVAALAMAGWAWYETMHRGEAVATGPYHKIIFGDSAMLIVALLAAALLTVLDAAWQRALAVAALLLALYAMLLSATRGAWLYAPIMLALLAWLYRHRLGARAWRGAGLALLAVALLLALARPAALVAPLAQGVDDVRTFLTDPGAVTSWGLRLNMWRNSLLIWREQPLLGTGIGDFRHDSQQLVAQGVSLNDAAADFSHAHSIYFDALATMGLAGLVVLLAALLVLPWRLFYRRWCAATDPWQRFYSLAGLLTVAGFAVFGLSEGWLSRNPFVNSYVFHVAFLAAGAAVRPPA